MAEQYLTAELEKIVGLLEAWARDQAHPINAFYGICYNLPHYGVSRSCEGLIAKAAESWPEFSGNPRYPVPHQYLPPESAYAAKRKVPKWTGEYGAARRRLCQHVADWIRAYPAEALRILHWR